MKKVKLTKLSDDAFNGNHPNGIYEGYVAQGFETNPPTIGERYEIHTENGTLVLSTSIVQSGSNKDGIFKTTYSTYKVEYK